MTYYAIERSSIERIFLRIIYFHPKLCIIEFYKLLEVAIYIYIYAYIYIYKWILCHILSFIFSSVIDCVSQYYVNTV